MGNEETRGTALGYRIIKVFDRSPARKAGLTEFLDYIVDISTNGEQKPLNENYNSFYSIIGSNENKEITLKVYNILHRKFRIIRITPNKNWEGADSLLGILVRYEDYLNAPERALRVIKVYPNSPASTSGLQPEFDYILGTPQYMYNDLNSLASFIELTQESAIKSMEICIYNSKEKLVRSTLLIPNKNWGGTGLIGCEFGLGILNHLPIEEEPQLVATLGEEPEELDKHDEKHEEIVPQLISTENISPQISKPPSDTELTKQREEQRQATPKEDASYNFDLSQEATQQRMKQLMKNSNKGRNSNKKIQNPFNISPNHSSNPFYQANTTSDFSQEISKNKQSEIQNTDEEKIMDTDSGKRNDISNNRSNENIPQSSEKQKQIEESEGNQPQKNSTLLEDKSLEEKQKHVEKIEILADPSKVEENKDGSRMLNKKIQYRFFSKKLNSDYVINSTDLFSLDELRLVHQQCQRNNLLFIFGENCYKPEKAFLNTLFLSLN